MADQPASAADLCAAVAALHARIDSEGQTVANILRVMHERLVSLNETLALCGKAIEILSADEERLSAWQTAHTHWHAGAPGSATYPPED